MCLENIGDHLRKKRLDLTLYQKDVARLLGVDVLTVCNWENNLTNPRLDLLPKIFKFLGYNPTERNASSFGERITRYRNRTGLSLRKLAKSLDVDPGTLGRWENNKSSPSKGLSARLSNFIEEVSHE